MISEPKRHHYLPQFYLENFIDTAEGQLWVRTANDVKPVWRRRGTRAVAYETDYYMLTNTDGESDTGWEKHLGQLETITAPVLRKIVQGNRINLEDRSIFAAFIADLMRRVPATRQTNQMRADKYVADWAERMRKQLSERPQDLAEFLETTPEVDTAAAAQKMLDYLNPDLYQVRASKGLSLRTDMGMLPLIASWVYQMGWIFIRSDTSLKSNYFITSDSPVVMMRPQDPFGPDQGFIVRDIEITLPLSRDMAFFAHWASEGVQYDRAEAEVVRNINFRTTFTGKKMLIAPKRVFPGSDRIEEVWHSTRIKTDL